VNDPGDYHVVTSAHAPYVLSVFNGSGTLPSTNSTLFLALNAVIMDLLHEW